MVNTLNLSGYPYFDDYNEDKNYLRMLFRPGYSVQTRELTQLQTILQKQIDRFGRHMFKEGSMIIPGAISYDVNQYYAKLEDLNSGSNAVIAEWFSGATVTCSATGVAAKVVDFVDADDVDPKTLYFQYIHSGNTVSVFRPADEITITASSNPNYIGLVATIKSTSDAVGTGSAAFVEEGVYFTQGFFVKVLKQKIYLSKYSNTNLSFRVGLQVNQSIVTEKEDPSLFSNATGEPNYVAPGAHRLQVNLVLTKIAVSADEEPRQPASIQNFMELLVIKDDVLYKQVKYTEYNVLEQTLARRTYDESGDYTVKPFPIQLKEYLDDGTNNGLYKRSMIVDLGLNTYEIQVGDTIRQVDNSATGTVSLYNPSTKRLTFVQSTVADFAAAKTIEVLTGVTSHGNVTSVTVNGNDYGTKVGLIVEPGKAYVKGHEIEKIAREIVPINKALNFRSINDMVVDVTHGNAIYVRDLSGNIPKINFFQQLDIHNVDVADIGSGTKIGTCRVKSITYNTGTIGEDADDTQTNDYAKYFLHIFDVQMTDGKNFEDAQSFKATSGFGCNIETDLYKLPGVVTGDNGTGVLNGSQETKFLRDLKVGNILVIRPGGGATTPTPAPTDRMIIQIDSVTSDYLATYSILSHSADEPLINKDNYYVQFASLDAPINNLLIYNLPNRNIKRLIDFSGIENVDVNFSSLRTKVGVVAQGAPNYYLNIQLTTSGESFSSNTDDYIVYNTTTSEFVEPTAITFIDLVNRNHIHLMVAAAGTYDLLFRVDRRSVSSYYKMKIDHVNEAYDITDANILGQDIIRIGDYLDAYQINHIWMDKDYAGAFNPSDIVDIADRYNLDSGQRDNYYDYANILRKKNSPIPTGAIRIQFNYFEHDASTLDKAYYCANSYDLSYDKIPAYISSDGSRFELRDCVDFRPDVTDFDLVGSTIELHIPEWGFIADYEYYLNRKDKLVLTTDGQFQVIEGVADVEPLDPETPGNSMLLYNLFVPAYTSVASDVETEFVENKRYTMRDIGKLEKRIENAEYYLSLTLLEKETADMKFRDPVTGLDRFKLGFIVDPFNVVLSDPTSLSDITSSDCRVSVDIERTECRPQFNQKLVRFDLNSINQSHIQITGDVVTLAYTEKQFITQPIATYVENVNPYNISSFRGVIQLEPPFDTWKETQYIDAERINVPGDYESLDQLTKQMGTVWNDWETSWSGFKNKGKAKVKNTKQIGWELKNNEEVYFSDLHFDNKGNPLSLDKFSAQDRKRIEKLRKKVDASHPKKAILEEKWTQSRTGTLTTVKDGVKLGVEEKITEVPIGDKVVSVKYIATIRPKLLQFNATRLKPNTVVYPFFDGKPVSNYCSTGLTPDLQVDGVYHVVPDILKTGATGEITGYFEIPNNDSLSFATGDRKFRLTSSHDNQPALGENPTFAETSYRAEGIVETKQNTILSIRNAEITQQSVSDTDSLTIKDVDSWTKEVKTEWVDPIAQTFFVDSEGGAFITSVDIFFKTKSDTIPIELQIREITADQRPSPNKILPFSRVVLDPSLITLPTVEQLASGDLPATNFKFNSPVYLLDKTVYAVTLISDSDEYTVFVANLTTPIPSDTEVKNIIVSPPDLTGNIYTNAQYKQYLGVFFRSQNGGTWSDDQLVDLKFNIYKAEFNTDYIGSFEMLDSDDPNEYWETLPANCFKVKAGSRILRVFHPNHNFKVGQKVSIAFSDDTPLVYYNTTTSLFEDIPNNLLGEVTILSTETDYYTVQSSANNLKFSLADKVDYSGYISGSLVRATACKKMDTIRTMVGELNFGGQTDTRYQIETVPFADDNQQSIIQDILPNENFDFQKSMIIYDPANRRSAGTLPSAKITTYLHSENSNISPVVDLQRFSGIAVSNRLDNPDKSINNTSSDGSGVDDVIVVTPSQHYQTVYNQTESSFTLSATPLSEARVEQLFNLLTSGKYIKIPEISLVSDYLITRRVPTYNGSSSSLKLYVAENTLVNRTDSDITLILEDYFVDELAAQGGSCAAKYVTKRVSLANSATALKVLFAGYRNAACTFDVYVKTLTIGDNRDMDEIEYVKVEPDKTPLASMTEEQTAEYSYSLTGLAPFTAIVAKVVLRGAEAGSTSVVGTAMPPRIPDIRVIALES